ncbi:hypothetical protein AC1031_003424 [Aphanomyces cochlioides]|nr:hypothetical protein AC1031_003424 [Aphanomyces cochlioides]
MYSVVSTLVAAVLMCAADRAITTCSSLHGPHCFALNERNVPSYLLQDVEFESAALDSFDRQPIPRIEVQTTKLSSHGFVERFAFENGDARTLTEEDAKGVLAATDKAIQDLRRNYPGFSEDMYQTAMQIATKKINALVEKPHNGEEPPLIEITLGGAHETALTPSQLGPPAEVDAVVEEVNIDELVINAPLEEEPSSTTDNNIESSQPPAFHEFSDDEILAFMLLTRAEKNILLAYDTARTRRLIIAQGRYIRRQKKQRDKAKTHFATDEYKDISGMTAAFKQRIHDLVKTQSAFLPESAQQQQQQQVSSE